MHERHQSSSLSAWLEASHEPDAIDIFQMTAGLSFSVNFIFLFIHTTTLDTTTKEPLDTTYITNNKYRFEKVQ